MVTDTLNKRVTRVYSAETWTKARELYLGGMSLEAVGEELGVPYPTIRYHAWVEDWGVRAKGVKRDPRLEAARAKKLARKLKREESLMIVQTSLAKTENLEVLARKCLKADSARVKVMMSRVVTGLLSRLDDPTIPARSAAQALGALAPILKLLYGWDREPELQRMERAKTSYADLLEEVPNNAVNLALVNTTPEQLRAIANEQLATENQDGQPSASGTESANQCVGPPPVAPQQPRASWDAPPTPEKEAPKHPLEGQLNTARPLPGQEQTSPPEPAPLTPGSQAWHRLRIEELDRLPAEWRGRR